MTTSIQASVSSVGRRCGWRARRLVGRLDLVRGADVDVEPEARLDARRERRPGRGRCRRPPRCSAKNASARPSRLGCSVKPRPRLNIVDPIVGAAPSRSPPSSTTASRGPRPGRRPTRHGPRRDGRHRTLGGSHVGRALGQLTAGIVRQPVRAMGSSNAPWSGSARRRGGASARKRAEAAERLIAWARGTRTGGPTRPVVGSPRSARRGEVRRWRQPSCSVALAVVATMSAARRRCAARVYAASSA